MPKLKGLKIVEKSKETKENLVDNFESLDLLVKKVKQAEEAFSLYSQEQVDAIFKAVAVAANRARIYLAKLAVEETGKGIMEDKIIKNHFAAEYIYNKNKKTKTCGVIKYDQENGYKTIAAPLGVLAGVIPVTNPTSTVIFKTLITLKTRNAIIFSPHPKASKAVIETAKIMLEAAVKAGAPENIIGWIDVPSVELSKALMTHPLVDCILATGGPGMVKAAYSSGVPALGVGSGNTPAIIDESADIKMAVSSILLSKTFDNGMICASEQSVIVDAKIYQEVKKEFQYRGACIVSAEQGKKLAKVILNENSTLNPEIVGQPAHVIAKIAGFSVAENTKVLIAERERFEENDPFAYEKLSPILSMYRGENFKAGVDLAYTLVKLGGAGHTCTVYINSAMKDKLDYFVEKIPTCRLLVNSPASQGGIGDLYNFKLTPSLTLGCGSWGKNSVSGNVSVENLLNYKTVAERRENMLWFKVPSKIYFKRGAVDLALRELEGKKRAFIVTDKFLFDSGVVNGVIKILNEIGVTCQVFSDVKPDPTLFTINQAMGMINSFCPDVFIAVGGGSPMDAAKIMWLKYEHPEINFEDISMRFMDIRKRVCSIPSLGNKAMMVALPTTSGTGSEVTPFAVITDEVAHVKYAIADYALTPNMAIIDPNFVDNMPKGLTSASGVDALVHSLEAYVSCMATSFTDANVVEAMKLIFKYLERSYKNGKNDPEAREQIHYAATIAGMAFANSFLGICHSMAHKLGAMYSIPHGIANILLVRQVIKYNSSDQPAKQAAFPQYKFPCAKKRYAELADVLKLGGKNDDEKVTLLIKAVDNLMDAVEVPKSIKEFGIDEKLFLAQLDELVELAYDDQCTGANPVYPLFSHLKQLFLDAYYGKV